MNVLVFDIETVPDVDAARRLNAFTDLSDAEVAEAMFAMRRQAAGTEMQRHHLHKIVAISAVYRSSNQLSVWSLGEQQSSEAELISRFFQGIERYTPTLVSWNGTGFDLPVLHYRALMHGVVAPLYWEQGENESNFRWNNYVSRYHARHTDLMDIIALYQPRCFAPLDEIAALLGFPGKMGMSGSKVWQAYLDGELKAIRDYCETDVLNTFLVYLRFQLMRGQLSHDRYFSELEQLKRYLAEQSASEQKPHLAQFLSQWNDAELAAPWPESEVEKGPEKRPEQATQEEPTP